MALIFCDGFDHYATADILKKWDVNSGATIDNSIYRSGTSSLKMAGWKPIYKSLNNLSTIVIGFGLFYSNLVNNSHLLCSYNGSTENMSIFTNSNGSITVKRGSTILGVSNPSIIVANAWCYLEVKFVLSNITGEVEVRINNNTVLALSNIDTVNSANEYIDNIRLGSSQTIYIDDLYIDDSDFLGDIKVETLYPSGAGTTTQWDALSGNNYENVDEVFQDGDTSYVSTATANEIDTYTFGNLATTSGTVYGVQVNMMARKDDAGSRSIAPVVRPSNIDRIGNSVSVSDSYVNHTQTYATNPDDNEAWTIADVNGAEFGVKLIE